MMLSVIICTYNRDKYIFNVLESLAENNLQNDRYEIIVVNNNCSDNTEAEVDRFVRTWPKVQIQRVSEPRQGLSYARNKGIEVAKGDVLIYVDDDAVVNEYFLANYAELFSRRTDIQAAGGPIACWYENGQPEPEWMNYYLKRLLTGYLNFGKHEREFPAGNYPGGGNAAYRASVFKEVGLYNVKLGRIGRELGGSEEKDIFAKMDAKGMKFVYTPGSILYHIIQDYKLSDEYFRKVTLGVGESERTRTLAISKKAYVRRLLAEVKKWCGTLVLWFINLCKGKVEGGNKLVKFRANVTRGLLNCSK